jgi:hypothetical protein
MCAHNHFLNSETGNRGRPRPLRRRTLSVSAHFCYRFAFLLHLFRQRACKHSMYRIVRQALRFQSNGVWLSYLQKGRRSCRALIYKRLLATPG